MTKLKIVLFFIILSSGSKMQAQQTFIVDGDILELVQEVKGPLSLYWSTQEVNTRYFVQKGNRLVELEAPDIKDGAQKKFQQQLENLTTDAQIPAADVEFVLYSLKHFVNLYNQAVQEDYEYNVATDNIMTRIGIFIGLSNNKYTHNPNNIAAPVIGLEFELYNPVLVPRHSAFFHLRQSFKQDEYQNTSSQLSFNYRFKFLYFSNFNFHIDTELATFLYSQDQKNIFGPDGNIIGIEEDDGFSLIAPLSFGIGSDIKITEGSFITISYNDIVSIFRDGNGSFPVDFTIGYKYNL